MVAGHLLPSLIDLAAGVAVLVCPLPSALVLTLIVGAWAVADGVIEFAAGSRSARVPAPGRCSCSAGWCRSRPAPCKPPGRASARSPLALLFGLFAIVYGVSQITLGSQLRQGGATLHSVMHGAA
jgi:uncharacterized membrane protein HdeD (DUF308 family)